MNGTGKGLISGGGGVFCRLRSALLPTIKIMYLFFSKIKRQQSEQRQNKEQTLKFKIK